MVTLAYGRDSPLLISLIFPPIKGNSVFADNVHTKSINEFSMEASLFNINHNFSNKLLWKEY